MLSRCYHSEGTMDSPHSPLFLLCLSLIPLVLLLELRVYILLLLHERLHIERLLGIIGWK